MDMGTRHRDDPRRSLERQELAAQSIGNDLAQVLWDLNFIGAELARNAV